MLDQILELDKELLIVLNNLGSETWDGLWLVITNKLTFIPLYALLLFLIYKKYGLKYLLPMIFIIAAMITFTDQITNVFKDGFMRARPCRAEGVKEYIRFRTFFEFNGCGCFWRSNSQTLLQKFNFYSFILELYCGF